MTLVDIIGYVASLLVVISLTMKSVLRLRLIGVVASATFFVYGLMLPSAPMVLLNSMNVFIHLYFIVQMLTQKTYFKLLEVEHESAYLQNFLEYYQKDIARFFPNFQYKPDRVSIAYLILRDLQPVGLFIMERDATGRAIVKLDYVIPGYRDLKAGQFLYQELEQRLPARGITTLYSVPGSEEHFAYLSRMGFTPQGDSQQAKLYARVLKA